jgi:hypothetical protein
VRIPRVLGVIGLLLLGGVAGAQNLVVNGDFASDVSGWGTAYSGPGISIAWSALDPADPIASGSAEVTSITTSGSAGGADQCVELISGPLVLRMNAMTPTQPDLPYVAATPWVRWYGVPGCISMELATTILPVGSAPPGTGWHLLSGPITPPDLAKSVQIILGVVKEPGYAAPGLAYFDDVYLPEPGSDACALAAVTAFGLISVPGHRRAPRSSA